MMKSKKEVNSKDLSVDYMSAEQLKTRFYEYFRNSGTFSDLQVQLRSKLIHEMFKISSNSNPADIKDENTDCDSQLPLQICNWLVYDHLKRLKYEYSLSTFVTEASLPYPKNLLSIKDILRIFEVCDKSSEYEAIYSTYANKNNASFLYSFLNTILMKNSINNNSENISIKEQPVKLTDRIGSNDFSFDHYHSSQIFRDSMGINGQKLSIPFQNDDTQFCRLLQLEKEKYEHEIQLLRQKLLVEFDALYAREQQSRMEIEQKKLKLSQDQEAFNLEKERFQAKELEINTKLQGVDLEVEAKLKYLKDSLLQRKKELELKEAEFDRKLKRFENEHGDIKSKNNELETLERKYSQLQQSYKYLQDDFSAALNENEQLKGEMKTMLDYRVIKEELIWKSKKLEHFEKELILLKFQMQEEKMESLNTIQKLQQHLVVNTPVLQFASQYPETSKNAFHLDEKKPQDQNSEDKMHQMYKDLLSKIEDQKQDIQELHRLIHNLHYVPPQKQDKETSPIRELKPSLSTQLPQDMLLTINEAYSSAETKDANVSHTVQNDTIEIHSNYYKNVQRKLDALLSETEASEQKFHHYIASQPKLFPNIHTPLRISSVVHDLEIPSRALISSIKPQLGSSSFENTSKNFNPMFQSKVRSGSLSNEVPNLRKCFDTSSYITQNPIYTSSSHTSSFEINKASSNNFNVSSNFLGSLHTNRYLRPISIDTESNTKSKENETFKMHLSDPCTSNSNHQESVNPIQEQLHIEKTALGRSTGNEDINSTLLSTYNSKQATKYPGNYNEKGGLFQQSNFVDEPSLKTNNSINNKLEETHSHHFTNVDKSSVEDKEQQIPKTSEKIVKSVTPVKTPDYNSSLDLDTLWNKNKIGDMATFTSEMIFTVNEEKTQNISETKENEQSGVATELHEKSATAPIVERNREQENVETKDSQQVDSHKELEVKGTNGQINIPTSSNTLGEVESHSLKNIASGSPTITKSFENTEQILPKAHTNEVAATISAVRNTASEMSSSELDDKGPTVSELSDLNLSVGSELDKAKNVNDEDDGW